MPQIERRESSLANSAFQTQSAKVTAVLDSLTGIASRGNFSLALQRWVAAHKKSEDPYPLHRLRGPAWGDEFVILSAGMRLSEAERRFSNLLRMIKSKS